MLVWFCQWRQEYGLWPSLPECGFQVGALTMATIKTQVVSVTSEVKMTLGERQVLRVLTTFQYLAEMGPKSLPPGHITQCESLSCGLCSKQRSHLCLMLYWDMPCQPAREVPQSKLTYHAPIYPHCCPVWVQLWTCLDLIIDFNLVITSQPWEK